MKSRINRRTVLNTIVLAAQVEKGIEFAAGINRKPAGKASVHVLPAELPPMSSEGQSR